MRLRACMTYNISFRSCAGFCPFPHASPAWTSRLFCSSSSSSVSTSVRRAPSVPTDEALLRRRETASTIPPTKDMPPPPPPPPPPFPPPPSSSSPFVSAPRFAAVLLERVRLAPPVDGRPPLGDGDALLLTFSACVVPSALAPPRPRARRRVCPGRGSRVPATKSEKSPRLTRLFEAMRPHICERACGGGGGAG